MSAGKAKAVQEDVRSGLCDTPRNLDPGSSLIHIGYAHASLIGIHRPDVAYPDRKIKRGESSVGRIVSDPCPCADKHVEVWVKPIRRRRLKRRSDTR